ncbi:MAG: DUF4890 domain-containing protein [Bacteroidales bacterium]|nr:DUF4890 domain-containing protein [Bacteroidales bacterium]
MKKSTLLAAAVGMLCAVTLQAQEGKPEKPAFPEPMSDSLAAVTRTQEMVEKYGLTPEQEGPVFKLNLQYANQLLARPERPEGERGERPDFRSMSETERQAFFQKMQERREEMEKRMAGRREARKAYDQELEQILTKEQFKAYRKDQRKRESEMQQRMQGGRPGMGPGGRGGNRGGFGGGNRGGFGGGDEF